MKEDELIQRLTAGAPANKRLRLGPGDDCAVLDCDAPGLWELFKTDAVVEGVHFEPDADPGLVGRKALARCLSDIAAMGGTPSAALVTLGLPSPPDTARLEALYRGLYALAREYEVAVAGGETVAGAGRLFLSVAALGFVEKERCVLRRGARLGDALFVTGELGGSIAGKHLTFEPRVREARWLTNRFALHAMMDLSDGLASDLPRLLRASGVGAELLAEALPLSRAAKVRFRSGATRKRPLEAALTDGEDYELLFAVASKDAVPLLDAWKEAFPETRLSCIGKITSGGGMTIRERKSVRRMELNGYDHLTQS